MTTKLLVGDCRATLATLPERSVQAVITSPPYYGLRSYIADGDPLKPFEIGLEPTPELFIEHLVEVFRAVRRVLRDDGVLWVNMGDSYAGSGKGPSNSLQSKAAQIGNKNVGFNARWSNGAWAEGGKQDHQQPPRGEVSGYKPKDLMMIPARVAMALQADGWFLRSQIPWLKRNSMPESVTDRPSSAVEYVYLFSKSSKYFYDGETGRVASDPDRKSWAPGKKVYEVHDTTGRDVRNDGLAALAERMNSGQTGRNRRNSDWFFESWQGLLHDEQDEPLALVVNPAGYSGAHFATFPVKLVEPMVKAGTSERGCCPECGAPWVRVTEKKTEAPSYRPGNQPIRSLAASAAGQGTNGTGESTLGMVQSAQTVGWRPSCAHPGEPVPCTILDCFGGAGTVGLVADRLGRNAIMCELKPDYADMGAKRVVDDGPMFADVEIA